MNEYTEAEIREFNIKCAEFMWPDHHIDDLSDSHDMGVIVTNPKGGRMYFDFLEDANDRNKVIEKMINENYMFEFRNTTHGVLFQANKRVVAMDDSFESDNCYKIISAAFSKSMEAAQIKCISAVLEAL